MNSKSRPRKSFQEEMRSTNFIESLPEGVLFKILVEHLSAEEIHESARLVCRKWHQLINTPDFVQQHLRRSNDMLFFHSVDPIAISLGHGRVEISKLRFPPGKHVYAAGCNGLVLVLEPAKGTLGIVNPLTRQRVALPHVDGVCISLCGIAYASVSMVYKVVVTTLQFENLMTPSCKILTVGVDTSWRTFPSARISFSSVVLITEGGGFMHWCDERSNQVLTLNIETEVIEETPPPFPAVDGQRRVFLSTGKYVSLLVSCGEKWEVWEMKPQTGEWRKVTNFSLEAEKNDYIAPIGWLTYPQVLVFELSRGVEPRVFSYCFVTRKIESIELPYSAFFCRRVIHKNSLVRV